MQTVSQDLIDAILSPERAPLIRVLVDWNRDGDTTGDEEDVSAIVESVSVDRSLTTEIPGTVTLLHGFASASASIRLAGSLDGDPDHHAAWLLSPANADSPLVGVKRIGAPITIDVGFRTASGTGWLRRFTGTIRSITPNSRDRSVTLDCLDYREKLRGAVGDLPVVAAVNPSAQKFYGLDGQWVIDWALRQCGVYASPPPRSGCVLSATLHGSIQPEIVGSGWSPSSYSAAIATQSTAFTQGKFAEAAVDADLVLRNVPFDEPIPASAGNGVLMECWVKVTALPVGDAREIITAAAPSAPGINLDVTPDGSIKAYITDYDGNASIWDSGLDISLDTWTYLGLQVRFNSSSTATCTFRVGSTTATKSVPTSGTLSSWGPDSLNNGSVRMGVDAATGGTIQTEAAQFCADNSATPTWNDSFTPTAVLQVSKNPLIGTPVVDAPDAWSLIQQIASAEYGSAYFDESGIFRFYNRDRYIGDSSVRTLTALEDLTDLSAAEAIDGVRNHIIVPAQPLALQSANSLIWQASEIYSVAAGGSLTVWANLSDPIYSCDTTGGTWASTATSTGSGWRANTKPDGSGTTIASGITVDYTVFASSVKMVIRNSGSSRVYLVTDTTGDDDGNPARGLWLRGQLLQQTNASTGQQTGLRADVSDEGSIDDYGEQPFTADDNPWRQTGSSASGVAAALLANLKYPQHIYTIGVVGDPRLQLGDKVIVKDTRGLATSIQGRVTAITDQCDPSGYAQQIALVAAPWTLGDLDAIWSGKTLADLDDVYAGKTLGVFSAAPLRSS